MTFFRQKLFKSLLFALITAYSSTGQVEISQNPLNAQFTDRSLISIPKTSLNTLPEAKGSPYINEEKLAVKISVQPDRIFFGRYNAFSGQMEIDLEENKVIALEVQPELQITFLKTGQVYKAYEYFNDDGTKKKGFLTIVADNNTHEVLKEEIITYIEGKLANTSYEENKPASFKRLDDVYYLNYKNHIYHLPTNRKKMLKAFPKHASALKTFIKTNKIKLNRENDIVKTASFLTELL